jgi:cytochrome b
MAGAARPDAVRGPLVPPLPTTRVLVWDLPTRVLHALLAVAFVGAFAVVMLSPRRSPSFPLHMLLGAVAALVIVLRMAWGLVGSRYARFTSFAFVPRGERRAGHGPTTSWAALTMLASVMGVALTGAMATVGLRSARHLHHVVAWCAVALVALHLSCVAVRALRGSGSIALDMLDGKQAAKPGRGLRSSHPIVALLFLALVGGAAFELVRSYDAARRTLRLPGFVELPLGPGARRRVPRAPVP